MTNVSQTVDSTHLNILDDSSILHDTRNETVLISNNNYEAQGPDTINNNNKPQYEIIPGLLCEIHTQPATHIKINEDKLQCPKCFENNIKVPSGSRPIKPYFDELQSKIKALKGHSIFILDLQKTINACFTEVRDALSSFYENIVEVNNNSIQMLQRKVNEMMCSILPTEDISQSLSEIKQKLTSDTQTFLSLLSEVSDFAAKFVESRFEKSNHSPQKYYYITESNIPRTTNYSKMVAYELSVRNKINEMKQLTEIKKQVLKPSYLLSLDLDFSSCKDLEKETLINLPLRPQNWTEKLFSCCLTKKSKANKEKIHAYQHSHSDLRHSSSLNTLKELILDFSRAPEFKPNPTKHLMTQLSSLTQLQSLSLCFKESECVNTQFIESLAKVPITLKRLAHLNLNFKGCNRLRKTPFVKLLNSISKKGNQLKSLQLNLNECPVVDDDLIGHIGATLEGLKSLQYLNLGVAQPKKISSAGMKVFAEGIKDTTHIRALTLNFSQCREFGDECLSYLSGSLSKMKFLMSLDINFSYCKPVNDDGVIKLARILPNIKLLSSLTLNFKGCDEIEDYSVESLCENIAQCDDLIHLELDFSMDRFQPPKIKMTKNEYRTENVLKYISNQSVIKIAESLPSLPKLRNLTLGLEYCHLIRDKSVKLLCTSIQGLKELRQLTLKLAGCNGVTDYSLSSLGSALSKPPNLKDLSLNFDHCDDIEPNGVELLVNGISKAICLESLILSFRGCRDIKAKDAQQIHSLAKGIKHIKGMKINFDQNMIKRLVQDKKQGESSKILIQ